MRKLPLLLALTVALLPLSACSRSADKPNTKLNAQSVVGVPRTPTVVEQSQPLVVVQQPAAPARDDSSSQWRAAHSSVSPAPAPAPAVEQRPPAFGVATYPVYGYTYVFPCIWVPKVVEYRTVYITVYWSPTLQCYEQYDQYGNFYPYCGVLYGVPQQSTGN